MTEPSIPHWLDKANPLLDAVGKVVAILARIVCIWLEFYR